MKIPSSAFSRGLLLAALFGSGCAEEVRPQTSELQGATLGGAVDDESEAALRASPVPVFVFPARYQEGMRIMSGEHWAAVSMRHGGIAMNLHISNVVHGSLTAEELATLPPAESRVLGHAARTTLNEQIRSVAWDNGSGVFYSLDVECEAPFEDPRCTHPDFVLEVANALVPAGGLR